MPYCLPKKVMTPHHVKGKADMIRPYMFEGVNYCDREYDLPEVTESGYRFKEIPFMPNVKLVGYYQSWKYFDEYREEILNAFGFKWSPMENCVSVHVRRGDYLNLPKHHPTVTLEYLQSAMKLFPSATFFIFSDDAEWCIQQFWNHPNCYYEGTGDPMADLQKASCCQHHIGSNSSFSFWIAYLSRNPEKQMVFPKNWFGPELDHDTTDLLLPGSIII